MKRNKTRMERIEAKNLRPHPRAQREMLPSRLRKIMSDLDLDAIGVIHAVKCVVDGRDGTWIVDGQHRWQALMDLGLGDWELDVEIHLDAKTEADASRLFVRLNDRSSVRPYDRFVNEASAGLNNASTIKAIIESRGLSITDQPRDGSICCVSTLRSVFARDGEKPLATALDTILSAWGRRASAMEGKFVDGLSLVFSVYGDSVDRSAMVQKLAKYGGGVPGIIGDARGRQRFEKTPLCRLVASIIVSIYNGGRRSGKLDPL